MVARKSPYGLGLRIPMTASFSKSFVMQVKFKTDQSQKTSMCRMMKFIQLLSLQLATILVARYWNSMAARKAFFQ